MSTQAVMNMQVHAPRTASAHVLAVDDDPLGTGREERIPQYVTQRTIA
jgi:hypothetical protein